MISLEPLYRRCVKVLIHLFYKIEHEGFEHIPERGPVLIIANHVSYVDGVILQAICDRPIRFIIDQYIHDMPIVNYFMRHNRAIPILPKKESVEGALDEVSKGLEQGDVICIFPEGRLTYTGHIGRFKPGVEWVVERDPVPIYPVAIDGLWGGIFSRKYLRSRWRWFPKGVRPKVKVICGSVIHPGHVRVEYLQRVIMNLLHSM
jgi:1-acyl-sn-glycerol-3-phosphate acyltransferase